MVSWPGCAQCAPLGAGDRHGRHEEKLVYTCVLALLKEDVKTDAILSAPVNEEQTKRVFL